MTMPELPEIEILRRDLEKEVSGRKIKQVDVPITATIKRAGTKKSLAARLEGAKIDKVIRKGLWILFKLDTGEIAMMSLGDRSQITRNQNKDAVDKSTAVILTFTQGGQLRISDPAKSCEFFVVDASEVDDVIGEVGFDLVDEPVSWTKFGERLLRRKGKLKAILMEPSMLAGIGMVYSDEFLFEASLRFDRSPDTLTTQEIRRLYRAVVEIIHDSVKHGGATVGEHGVLTLAGKPGGYTSMINVYGRDGQMSPRARGPIAKSKFGSGYTYYCEQTQN